MFIAGKAEHTSILLVAILLLATLLRLYQLPLLPPGLNFDEAGSGVAALEILSGAPKLWWRLGGGQEPLWPYLAALSTALLGNIPLALRLPAVFVGILTVAVLYCLSQSLFAAGPLARQRHRLALLAAFGLAISSWHIHFSRLGFRAILLPLFSTLAIYFFWRCWQAEFTQTSAPGPQRLMARMKAYLASNPALIASSFFLALAVYSYLGARLLLFLPILFITLHWLAALVKPPSPLHLSPPSTLHPPSSLPPTPYSLLPTSYYLLLTLFLSPLIVYFAFNPADFVARSAVVSIFNPQWHQGDLWGTVWQTVGLTLGTFIGLSGDANPLVNLPYQPALSLWVAPFFVIGVGVSLFRLFSAPAKSAAYLLLLCWWALMLLPAILAPEGAPHHLRLIGSLIPTYIFVALGWLTILNLLTRFLPQRPLLPPPSFLLLTPYFLLLFQTYNHYFVRWPTAADFTLPYDLYAVRLATEMSQTPTQVAYILPMDVRAGEEARHYTLDYLWGLRQPKPYIYLPVDEATVGPLLTQAAQNKSELQVVRWTADKHREADAKELVTYLLETTAKFQGRAEFPVYNLETYTLPKTHTTFELSAINQPVEGTFTVLETGPALLRLEQGFVPAQSSAKQWLPVAISLTPLAALPADFKASLRLVDAQGNRVAQKDRVLLHNFHQGTSLWPPERVNEYYLLPLPPQLAPGLYTVTLLIYHPETLAPLLADGRPEVPLGQVEIR
jgi:hypothetical protein